MRIPKAFISYAWDGESHRSWVRELAIRLRRDGVEAILDQWEAVPGDLLPAFMETQVRDSDFVLIICTAKYKLKSEARIGGVGYEGDVMTGEVFTGVSRRKFVPILCSGDWSRTAPGWLAGAYYIDLTGDPWRAAAYQDLVSALHDRREKAPPLGAPTPNPGTAEPSSVVVQLPRERELTELGRTWLHENRYHGDWHKFFISMLSHSPEDRELRELGLSWLHENRYHDDWPEVWQAMSSR